MLADRAKMEEVVKEFYSAKTSEEQDKVIEANMDVIKLANKADQKLARAHLPASVRADQRTDEIPFVAGGKNVVKYGGGLGGCAFLGWVGVKLYKAWRG